MHSQSELVLEGIIFAIARAHQLFLNGHWETSGKSQVKLRASTIEIFEGTIQNTSWESLGFQERLRTLIHLYFPKQKFETIIQATFQAMTLLMCTNGRLMDRANQAFLINELQQSVKRTLFQFIDLEPEPTPTPRVTVTQKIVMSKEGKVLQRQYVLPKDLLADQPDGESN